MRTTKKDFIEEYYNIMTKVNPEAYPAERGNAYYNVQRNLTKKTVGELIHYVSNAREKLEKQNLLARKTKFFNDNPELVQQIANVREEEIANFENERYAAVLQIRKIIVEAAKKMFGNMIDTDLIYVDVDSRVIKIGATDIVNPKNMQFGCGFEINNDREWDNGEYKFKMNMSYGSMGSFDPYGDTEKDKRYIIKTQLMGMVAGNKELLDQIKTVLTVFDVVKKDFQKKMRAILDYENDPFENQKPF